MNTPEIEELRRGLAQAAAGVTASPALSERAAAAARRRRALHRTLAVAAATAAVAVVAVTAAGHPWSAARTTASPGTDVRTCPAQEPAPTNPGVVGDALLPAAPGTMLICRYTLQVSPAASGPRPYVLSGSFTVSGSEAAHLASDLNNAPTPGYPRRCPEPQAVGALFFKNAVGAEAVVTTAQGCTGSTDGRRTVDTSFNLFPAGT
jgi:hypothetical protein